MSDQPWLVVGLGNPGPSFAATRHNVGRVVVELLAERVGASFKAHRRGRADLVETRLGDLPGTRAILARPRSYMNESGGSVASVRDFFQVDDDHLVVVHDELDLPYGTLRIKMGGGDNGHNGLAVGPRCAGHRRVPPGAVRDRPSAGPDGSGRVRVEAVLEPGTRRPAGSHRPRRRRGRSTCC